MKCTHKVCISIFNLELEKFGVDIKVLQVVEITREFMDWTEDWEKEMKGENFPEYEARCFDKYKNLSLEYNNGQVFTIYEGSCWFCCRRTSDWQLI